MRDEINSEGNLKMSLNKILVAIAFVLFSIIIVGLFSFFSNPSQAVSYTLSYIAGLSMIFLPCTLPLAFIIVPIECQKAESEVETDVETNID